ncbi:hypothetical protein B0A50_00097 [Salinomyces thailandicus]|uniref:Major facilitator superfamily (MFS) profile domain-containing protein n=1 Tax=Salinomyces thailandicus TaxID=706561 RepID=A0A4U0UFL5_9PEZI|nr:hypothetical protein B0A50_00097 [Salinomyces thailandica]
MDMHAPRDQKVEPETEFIDYSHNSDQSRAPSKEEHMSDDDRFLADWSEAEQSRLIRRVDLRLIPLCGLMYCVSLLDRTNLSNAAIAGMVVELELAEGSVDRYSIISLVFFITYTICQPPATILCRKIGPRIFLSTITLLWGIVMVGFGLVNNWETLIGLRLILGIFEAGFFPGVVYLLSTWYKRYEVGKRYATFYLIGCLASAFGGILAFGLMQMEGVGGYGGWRWIFIIEGLLTVLISCLGFLFMRSFPDRTNSKTLNFLTEDERLCILARVNQDRGDAAAEKFNIGKWARSGLDWKIWAYAMIFGCITTVSYALAYFLPLILRNSLGYSTGTSQCLVAPPYAFAGIVMLFVGWFGDRYHQRGICCAFNAILAIIGLAILGFASNGGVRYFGVFLATAGANANIPVAMTYQANNIRGQWKRAFCSATLVGFGALGGIVGTTVFRSEDAPGYVPGISVAMGSQVVVCLLVIALTLDFKRQNGKADRGEKVLEEGDAKFRYTY